MRNGRWEEREGHVEKLVCASYAESASETSESAKVDQFPDMALTVLAAAVEAASLAESSILRSSTS